MSATITRLGSDQTRSCGAPACGEGAVAIVSVSVAERYAPTSGLYGARRTAALVVPACAAHTAAVREALREVEA
jgi:hypothetical protein